VNTNAYDPIRPGSGRGHSSATLYEASKQPIALDPRLQAAWVGARLCGPAFTVQGCGGDNLALHHAVLAAPAGSVLVVDVGGARHGHWGEVLAVAARQREIAGLLIDGGVRDRDELRDLGFPVFSRRNSIVGTRKDYLGQLGVPVRVGGVVIATGDLIVGDADGAVAIPAADIDRVLDAADARVELEREFLDRLRAGATTLELYRLPGA
jgi:4-hydroxy-4-methyl-2-oxoglutarate aldolase